MTEKALDESRYGKLVQAKFYFDCGIGKYSKTDRFIRESVMMSGLGFIFFTGFFFLFYLGLTIPGLTLGTAGLVGGVIGAYVHIRETGGNPLNTDWYSMSRQGLFGWDLYENGILTRYYSEDRPGLTRRGFYHFNAMSKVYMTMNERNVGVIWDLLEEEKRKYCLEKGEDNDQEETASDDEMKRFIRESVWFVKESGELSDLVMDRTGFEDLCGFETFLRKKLGSVQ